MLISWLVISEKKITNLNFTEIQYKTISCSIGYNLFKIYNYIYISFVLKSSRSFSRTRRTSIKVQFYLMYMLDSVWPSVSNPPPIWVVQKSTNFFILWIVYVLHPITGILRKPTLNNLIYPVQQYTYSLTGYKINFLI